MLTIIGTGIKRQAHLTAEAAASLNEADKVYFLTNSSATDAWLLTLVLEAENLATLYRAGQKRIDSYLAIVAHVMARVRQGGKVCVVFYGHPGVFVLPSHRLLQQAEAEGIPCEMLPGISAEDCLFADLGVDPARYGCQSYEATDFLLRPRQFDIHSGLVLWQIGVIGNLFPASANGDTGGVTLLCERLLARYPADHMVYVYEAAVEPEAGAFIQGGALQHLGLAQITAVSTLYIPPVADAPFDETLLQRLGLSEADFHE